MITFENVLPHPLKENYKAASDIWQTTISFEPGKCYRVSAPSGKGKSTFLHLMYGLRKDFDGQVRLSQKETTTLSLEDWAGLRQKELSMVFQNLRLFPQLTGLENILVKNDLTNQRTEKEILAFAERLGVKEILGQTCGTMSFGQRQRIAIIRALCQPFSFLLLDEPFSHLDEENIKKACALISEICEQQQAGFILVSLGEAYFLEYDKELIL